METTFPKTLKYQIRALFAMFYTHKTCLTKAAFSRFSPPKTKKIRTRSHLVAGRSKEDKNFGKILKSGCILTQFWTHLSSHCLRDSPHGANFCITWSQRTPKSPKWSQNVPKVIQSRPEWEPRCQHLCKSWPRYGINSKMRSKHIWSKKWSDA